MTGSKWIIITLRTVENGLDSVIQEPYDVVDLRALVKKRHIEIFLASGSQDPILQYGVEHLVDSAE